MTVTSKPGGNSKKKARRFDAATRRKFLSHLAETANVTASAQKVRISTSLVYEERRRSEAFRGEWAESLAEGYAYLEAQLLSEALKLATGNIKDSTLKARAQKHRLALALLSAHRSTVKDKRPDDSIHKCRASATQRKQEIIARLNLMRERIKQNSAK